VCGRFVLFKLDEIPERYNVSNTPNFEPSYNIAPSQNVPVIIRQPVNSVMLMKWGLIPFWAKDPRIGYKLINARAETVSTAPSFRLPFKKQRCLVPANGFYEWKRDGKFKEAHYFKFKDDNIMSFAGLYDIWKDAEGHETYSYTIITTEPDDLMKPVHNRMPVILHPISEDTWLNNEAVPQDLLSLLKPLENKYLEEYVVSDDVNSPRNNSEKLITPSSQ
jgi:putative SOS response-associated peptidase YedK